MSKRLQVVMSDDEYRAVERVARRWEQPVAEVVRASLKRTVEDDAGQVDRMFSP